MYAPLGITVHILLSRRFHASFYDRQLKSARKAGRMIGKHSLGNSVLGSARQGSLSMKAIVSWPAHAQRLPSQTSAESLCGFGSCKEWFCNEVEHGDFSFLFAARFLHSFSKAVSRCMCGASPFDLARPLAQDRLGPIILKPTRGQVNQRRSDSTACPQCAARKPCNWRGNLGRISSCVCEACCAVRCRFSERCPALELHGG